MSDLLLTLVVIAALFLAVTLALFGGGRYKHHDADSHATEYAGIIKEGHGPLTVLLIVAYVAILLWTAVYLVQHRGDFTSSAEEQAYGNHWETFIS